MTYDPNPPATPQDRAYGAAGIMYLIALILGIFAIVMVIGGINSYNSARDLQQHAEYATAEVTLVEHRKPRPLSDHSKWITTVEFTTEDGETVTAELSPESVTDNRVGDEIEIVYNSTKPTEINLARSAPVLTGGGLFGIVLGTMSAVITAVLVLIAQIRVRRARRLDAVQLAQRQHELEQ